MLQFPEDLCAREGAEAGAGGAVPRGPESASCNILSGLPVPAPETLSLSPGGLEVSLQQRAGPRSREPGFALWTTLLTCGGSGGHMGVEVAGLGSPEELVSNWPWGCLCCRSTAHTLRSKVARARLHPGARSALPSRASCRQAPAFPAVAEAGRHALPRLPGCAGGWQLRALPQNNLREGTSGRH